eukprot:8647663-Heterocapsa_arctica.AAC.1
MLTSLRQVAHWALCLADECVLPPAGAALRRLERHGERAHEQRDAVEARLLRRLSGCRGRGE